MSRKLQIVVTSFQRLWYLQQTVDSLRQDDVEVFIADGGSDDNTLCWIQQNADGWLFFDNNPGADFLKTEGIKEFASDKTFVIASDDLVFPKGYAAAIMENFEAVNSTTPDGKLWQFCACSIKQWNWHNEDREPWERINGVWMHPSSVSQVSGAIMHTDECEAVGYFPNYGRSGQGDWAINVRFEKRGRRRCYWRWPQVNHIGRAKFQHYPDYSKQFRSDEDAYQHSAQEDDSGGILDPGITMRITGRRNAPCSA